MFVCSEDIFLVWKQRIPVSISESGSSPAGTSLHEELKHFWLGVCVAEKGQVYRETSEILEPSCLSEKCFQLKKSSQEHKAGVEFGASTSVFVWDCEHQESKVLSENKWLGRVSWKFWAKILYPVQALVQARNLLWIQMPEMSCENCFWWKVNLVKPRKYGRVLARALSERFRAELVMSSCQVSEIGFV